MPPCSLGGRVPTIAHNGSSRNTCASGTPQSAACSWQETGWVRGRGTRSRSASGEIADPAPGFQRVGSRRGIEMLAPRADQTLIEFILALPVSYLVRDGWTKWAARRWLMQDFGPEVRWRSDKEHFGCTSPKS